MQKEVIRPLFLWELKTVSGVNWFDSDGRDYSQFRPRYSDALLKWVASTAKEHGVLWDCATGNGQAAVGLARYFKQVIATDSAASQIEAAEVLSNIEYRQADAACSGLSADSVDCVTIAQAMHWFAYDDFFAEVKRVAKPGASVVAWCYTTPAFTDPQIQALWQRCYIDYLQPYFEPGRRYVEDSYASIPFPFSSVQTRVFRQTYSWTLARFLAYVSTFSAVKRSRVELSKDPVESHIKRRLLPLVTSLNAKVTIDFDVTALQGVVNPFRA